MTFNQLLAARKIIYDRHYADIMMLLERKYPVDNDREKNYKDPNHPDYNKLLDKPGISFGMLFDNELLLSLCKDDKERRLFNNDISLLNYYQKLIDNYGKETDNSTEIVLPKIEE
jgi:hypothetical protein